MEAIPAPRAITGPAVIDDLLDRVAERLSRDCNLRSSDCYRSYSARVTVDLQLVDIDVVGVSTEVSVGAIDPAQPAAHIAVGVNGAAPGYEALGEGLERPVDPAGATERPAPAPGKEKRWYPPRRSAPRV